LAGKRNHKNKNKSSINVGENQQTGHGEMMKEKEKSSLNAIGDNQLTNGQALGATLKEQNLITNMFMQTGKGSLMQRINSPNATGKGMYNTTQGSMNFGSTMATAAVGGNTGQSNFSNKFKMSGMSANAASPFRETIARGMVTGVGLLGKPMD
jgi:hypothetical protein